MPNWRDRIFRKDPSSVIDLLDAASR